jgi:hypothetical protein
MAAKKKPVRRAKKRSSEREPSGARPAFPYTTRPAALRKFLAEVPRRPKPAKVNGSLLASWGLGGGENMTITRVLKSLGLVAPSGEPTEAYTGFMREGTGPTVLGGLIRAKYAPLFGASLAPHKDPADSLRNLFNIHSSGAKGTIDYQIQTFKALCDYADLDAPGARVASVITGTSTPRGATPGGTPQDPAGTAAIHIDLHIHLPEKASSRDYQYIIQDIARFIMGKDAGSGNTERT